MNRARALYVRLIATYARVMRALIVDTDRHVAARLGAALSVDGYDVVMSGSGRGALAAVVERPPDVILLECDLSDLDGMEVCRQVRRLPRYMPIVMFSSGAGVDQRVKGLEAGADAYMSKPLVLAELLAHVRALVRRFEPAGYGGPLPGSETSVDATRTGSHPKTQLSIWA
jgi:two-component system phosphate regulon response regulator PhoB